MKALAMIGSLAGLALTVVPALLVWAGWLSWQAHAQLMFAGMLCWFACAPRWMKGGRG